MSKTSELKFLLADAENEPELRALLRDNPLHGSIEVALEREPNAFHAAAISGDEYELIMGFGDNGRTLLGAGARFELDAWINGAVRRLGYLGEFRIHGGLKQRRHLLLHSYRALRRFHDAGNTPFYLTTIIADNTTTRRLLERKLGDMPVYEPLETVTTFTIPARLAARRSGKGVERGGDYAGLSGLLAQHGSKHQFYPAWTAATLNSKNRCRNLALEDFFVCRKGDQLAGCLALWDQRSFKQTVVCGYAKRLGRVRPFFNLVAPLLGRPRLPAPGARLESAFLSHAAIAPDDEEALVALIAAASREALRRGIDYVMIAFADRNPLAKIVRKRFPCHSYVSMIYVVYWEDGAAAAAELDGRLPHPEMAIL
ncbi:MAG: hypothetical protein HKN55_12555 [Woeseiaceae bacterium]|nr:hypothetical protein [Woeseiaceae bacterium]